MVDEEKLWKDAHAIAITGASNPSGVLRTMSEYASQMVADGKSTAEIAACVPLQAMAGQLAYLFGQGLGPNTDVLARVVNKMDEIEYPGTGTG